MSMDRIPDEKEEQRAERIARQLQRARQWEDVLRALPFPAPSAPRRTSTPASSPGLENRAIGGEPYDSPSFASVPATGVSVVVRPVLCHQATTLATISVPPRSFTHARSCRSYKPSRGAGILVAPCVALRPAIFQPWASKYADATSARAHAAGIALRDMRRSCDGPDAPVNGFAGEPLGAARPVTFECEGSAATPGSGAAVMGPRGAGAGALAAHEIDSSEP